MVTKTMKAFAKVLDCLGFKGPLKYLLRLPPEVIVRLLRTIILRPPPKDNPELIYNSEQDIGEAPRTLDNFLTAFPTFMRYVVILVDSEDVLKKTRPEVYRLSSYELPYIHLVCMEGIQKFAFEEMPPSKWRHIQKMNVLPLMYVTRTEEAAGTLRLAGLSSHSLYRSYLMGPNTIVLFTPYRLSARSQNQFGIEMLERLAMHLDVPIIECFGGIRLTVISDFRGNVWFEYGRDDEERYRIASLNYDNFSNFPKIRDQVKNFHMEGRDNETYLKRYDFKVRVPRHCTPPPALEPQANECSMLFITAPMFDVEKVYVEYDTSRAPWLWISLPHDACSFSLLNTNWSFDNPFGWCCEHAYAHDEHMDQAHWSFYGTLPEPNSSEISGSFKTVVYVGLPDMMVSKVTMWWKTEFFYWKRLVPNLNSSRFSPLISGEAIQSPKLKGIKLFDKLYQREIINIRPLFYAPELERLVLVSLDGSDTSFDLNNVLYRVEDHVELHDVCIVSTASPSSVVPICWKSISPLKGLVRRLVIAGLYPSFVVDKSPISFSFLRDLSIDLSPLCMVDDLGKVITKAGISLDFSRAFEYPRLQRLYLMMIPQHSAASPTSPTSQGVFAANVDIELKVPSSLRVLDISTALQILYKPNIVVNGQKLPDAPSGTPVYEEQYFRWKVYGYLERPYWEFLSPMTHEQPFWDWVDQQTF